MEILLLILNVYTRVTTTLYYYIKLCIYKIIQYFCIGVYTLYSRGI